MTVEAGKRFTPDSESFYFRDWEINETEVSVRVIGDDYEPIAVWHARIDSPPDRDTYSYRLMGTLVAALEREQGLDGFSVSERRSYSEWGASGAGHFIGLDVAQWLLASAAAGVVGATVDRVLRETLAGLVRASRTPEELRPLDEIEAVERARWAVDAELRKPSEESPELEVAGVSRRVDGGWTIRLLGDGRRYEVELVETEGLVTISRTGWTLLDSPQ